MGEQLSSSPLSTLLPTALQYQYSSTNFTLPGGSYNIRYNPNYLQNFGLSQDQMNFIQSQNNYNNLTFQQGVSMQNSEATKKYGNNLVNKSLDKMVSMSPQVSNIFKKTPTKEGQFNTGKTGNVMGAIGQAADLLGSFIPEKSEYSGEKGAITNTLDQVYDRISDAAMAFGPIGCVCAGSRVINNEGKFVNIEDLTQEEGIVGWGNKTVNKESIFALKTPDYKECVRIELQSGTFLECSTDHPILYAHPGRAERITVNGKRIRVKQWEFKPAIELQIGDNIGIANEIPIWGSVEMWNPYLIGMLIGDGTYGKDHGVRLFSGDPDTWDYLENTGLGVRVSFNDSKYNKEFRAYRIINGTTYLRQLGIYEQTKLNKRLPDNIHIYTKESICKLIAGLIDTDGTVYSNAKNKEHKIEFFQKNKVLIDQIREQLLKLGIHCSIQKEKEKTNTISGKQVHSNEIYKLVIKDKLSLINFYNNIKLNLTYKQSKLESIYQNYSEGAIKDNRLLSGAKADKVISITPIGSKLVYNLQADNDHTYIANGIITHNTMIGGIMKGGALLGKGLNALGVGTDGKTTQDAILGSSFFNLTPTGLINSIFAKKSDTITKDNGLFEQVGASYTGTNYDVDQAVNKMGKYGLFSLGAMKKANRLIGKAKTQQSILTDVANEATDRFNIVNSMSAINGNRRAFNMYGGYNQADIRIGKSGLKVSPVKARQIASRVKLVKKITDPFELYLQSLPENQRDSSNFRVKDYWEFNGKPKDFEEAKSKEMFRYLEDFDENGNSIGFSWHANSVAENPITGEIEFMKASSHPTHYKEVEWYNSNDAEEFRNDYELVKSKPYWKYVRRKTPKHQNGGIITTEIELISPERFSEEISFIELISEDNLIKEFKNGGSINVIPEGALHARKHNMDIEGITKKGIPVVSEKENGEIEQQAEIEREELIIRLEITQKLEELQKRYYKDDISQREKDELALEAGKLLVQETLYNTIDNTKTLL